MTRLTDRLERDLREVAAGVQPSPSAWESIQRRLGDSAESPVVLVLAPAPNRSKRPVRAAVAAAALIVGLVAVLTQVGDDHSISTSVPGVTTTFVSPRNGFSVDYVDRGEGTVTPATQLWGAGEHVDDGFDVVETGLAAVFKGASTAWTESPYSSRIDEGIDEYLSDDHVAAGGCGVPRSEQAEITIDGVSGRVAECHNRIEATVVVGRRLYLFTLTHDRTDARAVFDAFVTTIDLTPETAVDFPGLTATFVSPTYGYSFGYIDRGGLEPATETWAPGNQALGDRYYDHRFDGVETGLRAYLAGASTPIPDGVSIDDWIDEYVTARAVGGCGVPRSEQDEITIDGQPGRIARCVNTDTVGQIEATVVAGDRLYLFALVHNRSDAEAFFDAWIATIDLTPETARIIESIESHATTP